MAIDPGIRFGPYTIAALIGSGGMGEVYRAHDSRLGRDVAVKVLPAELATDPERLRRFEHEARAAASLNHPNILAIHDVGAEAAQTYVVSELLEGQSLRDALNTSGVPVRKAVDYAIQIARGLSAAHDKGIVHRDLKPENLFITADGRVKILDFGLAKLVERTSAAPASSMSPTQAVGLSYGSLCSRQALGFGLRAASLTARRTYMCARIPYVVGIVALSSVTCSRSTAPSTPLNLTGTWSGLLGQAGSGAALRMTWSASHNGSSVSGPATMVKPAVNTPATGSLNGTLTGNQLSMTYVVQAGGVPGFPDCSISGIGSATAASSTISGSLDAVFTSCAGSGLDPTGSNQLALTRP